MAFDQEKLLQFYLANATLLDHAVAKYPRLQWALAYHLNIRGEPMRFHDKPYLLEIYKDNAEWIRLMSSVQTGKTEFLIIAAHDGAFKGLQVMYVLPSEKVRNDFVPNRIDKTWEMVPRYQQLASQAIGRSNKMSLKHFGNKGGAIFFLGSNSSTSFIEKPIDLICADETDRFDLENYEKAEDRMTASPYKWWIEASNPTVDNYGIHKSWKETDQRTWHVKCECCGYWQDMDWFKNVVYQTDDGAYQLYDREWHEGLERDIHFYCRKCWKPIYRFTHNSCWVALLENRKHKHGYHLHQLLSSYVKVSKIWEKFLKGLEDDTAMQVFYNSVLGLTYTGEGSKITDDVLNACKEDYLMPANEKSALCFMGVDVGKRLHVIIRAIIPGGRSKLVFAGTVKDFEELDYLYVRFNIVSYVLDSMPETRKAKEYAKKYTGRGWIARYHQGLDEIRTDAQERVVSADRTMLMDKVMAAYTNKIMMLPKNAQSLDKGEFYTLLKTPTRAYNPEKERYEWLGDPDHYYHAEVYCMLAFMARGDIRVVALDPANAPKTETTNIEKNIPKNEDEFAKQFPPGTPQTVIDQYRIIYEKVKAAKG
ncbi:MAG: terminase gpA endonuclease subunit [Pseudobdellovibrionaceae bacterium]